MKQSDDGFNIDQLQGRDEVLVIPDSQRVDLSSAISWIRDDSWPGHSKSVMSYLKNKWNGHFKKKISPPWLDYNSTTQLLSMLINLKIFLGIRPAGALAPSVLGRAAHHTLAPPILTQYFNQNLKTHDKLILRLLTRWDHTVSLPWALHEFATLTIHEQFVRSPAHHAVVAVRLSGEPI